MCLFQRKTYSFFSQTAAKILPEAWSFETYQKQLSNPDDISFLAICNGEAAGFISVWCVCGEAEINNIGVLEKSAEWALQKPFLTAHTMPQRLKKWYLEVRESNLVAISFYEKLGFERVGMRKNFYTAPTENAVLMALQPTENGEINDI